MADVVMLDLEDSVPVDQKVVARRCVINALKTTDWGDKLVAFRMNALDTPYGYRDLLEVIEQAGNRVDTVVVPKVDHPGDVHFVSRMLDGIEMNQRFTHRIGIEASVESARSMASVLDIAAASDRLVSLIFGIADYSVSIGAKLISISGHGENEAEIYPGHRWHFALSTVVMAAKANGLVAIDAPYGNFRDIQGLKNSAILAGALGCDGKWAIHPDQIQTINEVFSPSEEDINRAEKVINAIASAEHNGNGAVAIEGRMVDQATIRLAKQLYEQARYLRNKR